MGTFPRISLWHYEWKIQYKHQKVLEGECVEGDKVAYMPPKKEILNLISMMEKNFESEVQKQSKI